MAAMYLSICFFASLLGAICGIGGGVVIKPVLDAVGTMDVAAISFLSGCSVLSMSAYSVLKEKLTGTSNVERRSGIPLAIGAALGGLGGKMLFAQVTRMCANLNSVGVIQAASLFIVTLGTLIYTLKKNEIRTYSIRKTTFCVIIGIILGMISTFLGIGGGPINLVVLFFFFSMSTKVAVENSLCIILVSQVTSLLTSILTKTVPVFPLIILLVMVIGGILGGIAGRSINKHLEDYMVEKLFIYAMVLIMMLNVYNIYKFLNIS